MIEKPRICQEIVNILHDEATRIGEEQGNSFFPALLNNHGSRPAFVKKWISFMESISPEWELVPPCPEDLDDGMDWWWMFAIERNSPEMYCVPDPVSFFDGMLRVVFIPKSMGDKMLFLKGVPHT